MKRHISIILGLWITLSLPVLAKTSSDYFGTEIDIYSLGYPASSLSLAEANTAAAKNPFAGLYNPAGLQKLDRQSIYSMQQKMSQGVELFSVHWAGPLAENLVANINYLQLQVSDIPIVPTDNITPTTDVQANSFSAYNSRGLSAALAWQATDRLSLGLSAAGSYQNISNVSGGTGYGLSISPGLQYQVSPLLNVGVLFRNALSYQHWQTGFTDRIGQWVAIGADLSLSSIHLFGTIEKPLSVSGPDVFKLGAQYQLFDFLSLRTGYYGTHINAGIGLEIDRFTLDYAYIGNGQNNTTLHGDSSRITVGLKL